MMKSSFLFVSMLGFCCQCALLPGVDAKRQHNAVSIYLNLSAPYFTVSDQYLSITLGGSGINRLWEQDLTSRKVLNLARGLSPAIGRVGGKAGDLLIFNPRDGSADNGHSKPCGVDSEDDHQFDHNFTMNGSIWENVNKFIHNANWELIFTLNALLRRPWPNGTWESSNAKLLMDYTTSRGYSVSWELGNELNLKKSSIPISPSQLAADFKTLRNLVTQESPQTHFIAGPDVTRHGVDFLTEYLKELDQGILNAVTWHHYYIDGRNATLEDFVDPNILDTFMEYAASMETCVSLHYHYPPIQLWIGETADAFGGGAPGLSNTFLAGFMWLDKLGLAALYKHTRVMRQSFFDGNYALISKSREGSKPRPDYWLSLLHKRLVGMRVLHVKDSLEKGRRVRVYAHCTTPLYPAGSVVLLVLNLNKEDSSISLEDTELSSSPRDVYWLSPPNANITSQQVTLNGHLLELVNDTDLPDLLPQSQPANDSISLPSLSFGFYVFKNAKATACV